jgi:homoserine kinase type II
VLRYYLAIMPVQSTISEADFEAIISFYNLGAYQGFETFSHGTIQTTILLKTSSGKYVLRYYEIRPEKHVLFEIALFNYLKAKQYPVPSIIRTSLGHDYGLYKRKPFIVTEYIEGEHAKNPNEHFDQEQVAKVVEVVAGLHTFTKDYMPDTVKDREEYNAAYCLKTYRERPRVIDAKAREAWLKEELAELEFPSALPQGICHADLNYGNFLFRDGEIVAVLDFDMSFCTHLLYDVASLIYWWAWEPGKGFKAKEAAFMTQEYTKHRALEELEKRHLFDALKLLVLLGISWSEESEFEENKKVIERLNKIGRNGFYTMLFEV